MYSLQPPEVDAKIKIARKTVEKALNQVFKNRGQQLASIGSGTDTDKLPEFDSKTGTWENRGLASKPPRYLLQLRFNKGQVEVGNFIPTNLTGRLGAFNGIMRDFRGVPGVIVRLHLVILHSDSSFELFAPWEWLVLVLFSRAVVGATSSDALTNFLPPKATVTFIGKEIPIAAVSLFGIMPHDEQLITTDENGKDVLYDYQTVTTAIQEYLSVDYPSSAASI
jgi:hypothetical protein